MPGKGPNPPITEVPRAPEGLPEQTDGHTPDFVPPVDVATGLPMIPIEDFPGNVPSDVEDILEDLFEV